MKFALILIVMLCASSATAYEWAMLGGISALGGMNSFNGARGSFTGNLDGTIAPAVRLNSEWALLPSAVVGYQGTRPLTDVLGTATVNQQSVEARLGLRAIYARASSRWRFKPHILYGVDLLKETTDENWGQGLFDHRRQSVGLEIERMGDDASSLRGCVDWFNEVYPNYTSLESQAAMQFQGLSLARELVGDRLLDHSGYQFSLAGDRSLGARAVGTAKLAVVWSRFDQQHVIDEGGQFERATRQDILTDLALTARMPHEWNADLRAFGALEFGLTANSSNQNGYDATRGRFNPGFYDFLEWRAVPAASLTIGPPRRPVTLTARLSVKNRRYPHRAPQNSTGAYGSGSLQTTEMGGGLALSYPMAQRLKLLFSIDRVTSSSNQEFQEFYRYSYQSTTALAGVRWDW